MTENRRVTGRAPTPDPDLGVAWRMARRGLRGGIRHFGIFIACLVLGVAAIAGVGSLTDAIEAGLKAEGQSLLGGDLELRLTQRRATDEEMAFLADAGVVSSTRSLRAMVRHLGNDRRSLAEVKAVDDLYPLYGAVELQGERDLAAALAADGVAFGAAVAPELAERLDLGLGDRIRLGDSELVVRAILLREPDRANEGLELAPRLMVSTHALEDSGLLREGSINYVSYRIKLPPDADLAAFRETLEERFPDAAWRIRDRESGAPRLRDFAERVGLFLTLVGLTTLVVGGIGVGGAVREYLESRTDEIASLKVLGASSGTIARIYLMQILLMAGIAIATGLILGAALPGIAASYLAEQLPVPPRGGIYPLSLLRAALFGLLAVLIFALPPLVRARRVKAAALFRRLVARPRRPLSPRDYMLLGALIVAFLALPLVGSEETRFVLSVELGVALVLGLLLATGLLIRDLASRLPRPRRMLLRLAIANLHRPGAPTVGTVIALGLGLTLFATLALVEGNLRHQIDRNLPEEAPAFFFLDLQRDQIEDFTATAQTITGVGNVTAVPYLRGQIVAINGVAANAVEADPDSRWVLRGDRGLTFSDQLPADNRLVAGAWWEPGYAGPPQISFDAELARGLGIGIGDRMTITVLGRQIEAEIASLREIDWGSMGINFAIVFDPATLAAAPFAYLATLHATPAAEAEAYRLLTDRFPNVSAVRMKEVLGEIGRIVGQMGTAIRAAAMVTILAGALVLAGAAAAGARERIYDAVLLKVLGGTRRTILMMLVIEYLCLGVVTGLVAALLGTGAAYLVAAELMDLEWIFLPGAVAATIAASMLLAIVLGLAGTYRALSARPAAALRAFAQ